MAQFSRFVLMCGAVCFALSQLLPDALFAKEPAKSSKNSAPPKTADAAALRPMQADGSRVVMDLPPAFQSTPRFVGFYDAKREVSFVVSDMPPEAFAKLSEGFTPAVLKERGFIDPREGRLARSDTYLYRRFAQTSANGLYQKFVLIFTDGQTTGMIAGNVPTPQLSSGSVSERDVEAMLASARFAGAKTELPLVATLGDAANLKLALRYGQTQIWTVDGQQGVDGKSGVADVVSPAIILAASATFGEVERPHQFAAAALQSLAGHQNIALSGTAVSRQIGPHMGVELTASAEAKDKAGDLRALYQFLIPQSGGGYVRLVGIAPRADKDLWFASFRRSVASIKLKP